jgi:hypothetical protein
MDRFLPRNYAEKHDGHHAIINHATTGNGRDPNQNSYLGHESKRENKQT